MRSLPYDARHACIRPSPIARAAAMLAALAALPACATWRTQTSPLAQVIAEEHPEQLRITRTDGTVFTVARPTIANDSLVGVLPGSAAGGRPLETFAAAQADVTKVELRQRDYLHLVGSILLVPVVAGAGVLLLGD